MYDQAELLVLGFPWENRDSSVELHQDAAERPHIDCGRVGDAQNNFGCPVETWLDVSVDALVTKATGAEINYFYSWLFLASEQYIFWFQVAVNDVLCLEVAECLQNLYREPPDQAEWHSLKIIPFYELIQVDAEKLKWNQQVTAELTVVFNPNDIFSIFRVVVSEVHQDVQFDTGLVLKF